MGHHENATAPAGPPAYEPPTTLNVVPYRVGAAATGALIPPTYEVAMGQEEPTAAAAAPAVNTRCTALTHCGEQCSRLSVDGSEYCGQHQRIFSDPARQEQWLRRQQDIMEKLDGIQEGHSRPNQVVLRGKRIAAGAEGMGTGTGVNKNRQSAFLGPLPEFNNCAMQCLPVSLGITLRTEWHPTATTNAVPGEPDLYAPPFGYGQKSGNN